jgi:hypothetical protein
VRGKLELRASPPPIRPIAGSSEGLMLRARFARCWLTLASVVRGTERAKNAHEVRTCRNIRDHEGSFRRSPTSPDGML